MSSDNRNNGQQPENRDGSGRFAPGASGNPGGRPKDENGIAELARSHGPAALERLVQLKDSKDERVSLSACVALLDRGFGKPKQATELSGKDGAPLPCNKPISETMEWLNSVIKDEPSRSGPDL